MPDDITENIKKVCNELKHVLIEKNKSYGNSVIKPISIFSKLNSFDQINVRIDDKLNRIAYGNEYPGDDTEFDLIGYLILKRAIKQKRKNKNASDGSNKSS